MKTYLLLASTLAFLTGFGADIPAPTATNAQDIAFGKNTDEIDLEEMDDSADAAKTTVIKPKGTTGDAVSLIDISCDEATLADILRQFRKTTGANIIYSDSTNLHRRVSTELHRVPWRNALESILNTRGFRLETRGDIDFVTEDKIAEPVLTRSFTLNHASAEEMADLFNENYATKDAKGKTIQKIATPFSSANVVVVTATEKILAECDSIIRSVDKAVAQIYIEARFLELSSEALHKLGVDWSSLESWGVSAKKMSADFSMSSKRTTDDSLTIAKTAENVLSGSSSSYKTSGNSDSKGTVSSSSDNNIGFSGQLSADDFSLALSAFESLGEGKIFSNPKVIVSNGKEAIVDMTTKFPNVKLSSQRNTSTTSSYLDMSAELTMIPGNLGTKDLGYRDRGLFAGSCFYEWGITLSVKPRISPDGLISVEIIPAISQLDKDDGNTGFYVVKSDTEYGKFPIIQMKRIISNFTMKDGSTAVIGGLSRTDEEDVDTGIPYLRKLPWIGQYLFGWKGRQKVQKEIIVCVTIGIANPAELPKDIGLPKNAVIGREYVEGRRQEPGDREGGADQILALDKSTLDEQHKSREAKGASVGTNAAGRVSIRISKE